MAPRSDRRIHILPPYVANQIAAGEVVQRPESVVKELVENAIDAGATHITVVVREAGKQFVHVIDNGSGMAEQDLVLSCTRHATSKITDATDLHDIHTLGFRGEALASIAAVADVEIRTRQANDTVGHVLTSRPGHDVEVKAFACDPGTQVIVRNLFYNIPARRKFLKSDLTEFRAVSDTMQKLALSRPDLRFTFYDGSVLVFDAHPAPLRQRIADVMAVDPTQLVPVEASEGGVRIGGWVARPALARQSRSGQYLFMNQRSINSRALGHAVASAYEHLLEAGRHPVYVLTMEIDATRVDVNVHPQKHEVKFDDERMVYNAMQSAVAQALQRARIVPPTFEQSLTAMSPLRTMGGEGAGMIVNRTTGEVFPSSGGAASFRPPVSPQRPLSAGFREAYGSLFEGEASPERPRIDVLSAGSSWLVTIHEDGVAVIDQRRAHERVLYERILRQGSDVDHSGQALLFSVTIKLAGSMRTLLQEYRAEFASIGFNLDIHADGSVHVIAVPSDVSPGTEESVLNDMLHTLESYGPVPTERRRERLAAGYASKMAVLRSEQLVPAERDALVRDLFACAVPHVTPSGAPTYVVMTWSEVQKRLQ